MYLPVLWINQVNPTLTCVMGGYVLSHMFIKCLSPLRVCVWVSTWAICSGLLRVQFGFEWSSWLQFGFGELRQVGHHGLLVHLGINDLLRSYHLHRHTREFGLVRNQSALDIHKGRLGLQVRIWSFPTASPVTSVKSNTGDTGWCRQLGLWSYLKFHFNFRFGIQQPQKHPIQIRDR